MANPQTTRSATTPKPTKPTGKVLRDVSAPATAPVSPGQPKVEKAEKAPKVKRERSSFYAKYNPVDTHVVTVVPGCKGKRPTSKAGARWAVLVQNDGKTVAEVRAAYEAAKIDPKRLRNDLRWNLAHNLVTVV